MIFGTNSITKVLSANDTGETDGHQAGILVPKEQRLLSFFPKLDARQYNPRVHLIFTDSSSVDWEFAFIYYNNKLFGKTRNEYRLTRMTKYIREAGLIAGDEVILTRGQDGNYRIDFKRQYEAQSDSRGVLKLGSGWKVIDLEGRV